MLSALGAAVARGAEQAQWRGKEVIVGENADEAAQSRGRTWTREQLTEAMPEIGRKTKKGDHDLTKSASYAERVQSSPQSMDPRLVYLLDPRQGLRPFVLGQLQERELARLAKHPRTLNRATVYADVLRWLDANKTPPGQGKLPDGVLRDTAVKHRCNPVTVKRCILWAELTIGTLNITLS